MLDWDVVVLQEQSSLPAKKVSTMCNTTMPWAKCFAGLVRKYNPNATVQWYQTWARPYEGQLYWQTSNENYCSFEGRQDKISQSYERIACTLKELGPSRIAPVGEAFRIYKETNGADFYSLFKPVFLGNQPDHHQSKLGAYISACVHFSTIFGESCDKGKMFFIGEPSETKKKLRAAADAAVFNSKKNLSFDATTECDGALTCPKTNWDVCKVI